MQKYHIPTARYEVFDAPEKALDYLRTASFPIVIKADGLALGKGVLIPQSLAEAETAVKSIMEDKVFGASGNQIVVGGVPHRPRRSACWPSPTVPP